MIGLLILGITVPTPTPITIYLQAPPEQLLAEKIERVNPRARPYSDQLARSILGESRRHGLDPAVVTAIAWTESFFQRRPRGGAGEIGLWQLLPGRSLARRWELLRATRPRLMVGTQGWYRMSRRARRSAAERVEIGTALVALALVQARKLCRRWGHRHRAGSDSYAHYNTGGPWLRPGYRRVLKYRAEAIRRALQTTRVDLPTR